MKSKTVFYCSECGNETAKWSGRCPFCGVWNTLVEAPAEPKAKAAAASARKPGTSSRPVPVSQLDTQEEIRFSTGIGEFDRVLGGGAVKGSIVLVGGSPGIGKSTLLLQICGLMDPGMKLLYVTGEESRRQLKMRAQRLGVDNENLYVHAETDINEIIAAIYQLSPDAVIIDSVQTMYNEEINSSPGSVSQVKDCTMSIMQLAKTLDFTAFVVGHVNKDGAIAGPKVLEHMVDCVLYFEGDRNLNYRILRAAKNRFGSTNEIGVFEMAGSGLQEVPNPSETLLSGRPEKTPGTCVTCVMEGTRPILAEIQALVSPTNFAAGRRNSNGIDFNRATLLAAVLEKRGGMRVSNCDVYINVIGGLYLDETAADLATILAVASSYRDTPVQSDLAAVGEVGLTGEIRSIKALETRLAEIARLGFGSCIVPYYSKGEFSTPNGLEIIRVKNISAAISAALG